MKFFTLTLALFIVIVACVNAHPADDDATTKSLDDGKSTAKPKDQTEKPKDQSEESDDKTEAPKDDKTTKKPPTETVITAESIGKQLSQLKDKVDEWFKNLFVNNKPFGV